MEKFESLNQAWTHYAEEVLENGESVNGTKEKSNVIFRITDINQNILTSRENFSLPYYLGEMTWYGAGHDDVFFISKFGKIWEKLTDDGIHNNSAYGYILRFKHGFNQITKMMELLSEDPNSRRAVININIPNKNVIETKDEMCTIALQFLLRNGKLNTTGIMRSNDLWTGTPYDIFYFTEIQKYIADRLGVEYGTYTHVVTSMHIYDHDFEKIEKSISNYHDGKFENVKIDGQKLLQKAPENYWSIYNLDAKEAKLKIVELAKEQGIVTFD